jgi:hypothetical protein
MRARRLARTPDVSDAATVSPVGRSLVVALYLALVLGPLALALMHTLGGR